MKTNSVLAVWLLRGYYFFYFAMVGVYIVFMPKILTDIGYTPSQVGIIFASAPMMRFLLPFVFRYYIALTNRIFLSSLLLSVIAVILFWGTIDNFWNFLVCNLLFGAAMGISLPYIETISLKLLSKIQYGKTRLWGSVGFMAIVLWLGKVLESPNDGLAYLTLTAFLTLIFGAGIGIKDAKTDTDTLEDIHSFSLRIHAPFWISIFLLQVSFGGFYNFFTIYETSHGISLEVTSWMWSFGVICEIAMLYFQGPLLHRNLLSIIKFATFITALRWLILYLYPSSTELIFASQSLHAFSFALYHTAAISYVFTLYSQKKLAQQFFLGIAFGLGASVGALVAGKFYGDMLFAIEALIALGAFAILFIPSAKGTR
ncbi:MAG: MFS transporter [Campylobacterales bacterium]|nr:MFS transporter [Campylobacterales bacterium]